MSGDKLIYFIMDFKDNFMKLPEQTDTEPGNEEDD